MRVLVTGGAGYIGSHTAKYLKQRGLFPIVLDDLSTGHAEFAQFGPIERCDIRDEARVLAILRQHSIDAVIHFAAKSLVGESLREPQAYHSVNVGGMLSLLGAMRRASVKRLVFSSSAAVYGASGAQRIEETHALAPINPYGQTKRLAEAAIQTIGAGFGLHWAVLRYFNVIGADPQGELAERHTPETHLLPNLIRAAVSGGEFPLYGDSYPTEDGTAVRDYVDVCDLAFVHVEALDALEHRAHLISNVGSGAGISVRQMVASVERELAKPVRVRVHPPRVGDPPRLVADNSHFLSWSALGKRGFTPLGDSVRSVVRTLEAPPSGHAARK